MKRRSATKEEIAPAATPTARRSNAATAIKMPRPASSAMTIIAIIPIAVPMVQVEHAAKHAVAMAMSSRLVKYVTTGTAIIPMLARMDSAGRAIRRGVVMGMFKQRVTSRATREKSATEARMIKVIRSTRRTVRVNANGPLAATGISTERRAKNATVTTPAPLQKEAASASESPVDVDASLKTDA